MNSLEEAVGQSLRNLARMPEARKFFAENQWLYKGLLRCARRYIVGESLEEALERAVLLQNAGYNISLEYMGGEDTSTVDRCDETVREFIRLIIQTAPIIKKPNICFDLSVMGLTLSEDTTLHNLARVASVAKQNNAEVIISMEESSKTQQIINIYKKISREYDNVGLTIQAYLHRTIADLKEIINFPGRIRLVKGVYQEPGDISLRRSEELNARYLECLEMILKADKYVILGTHDEALIYQMEQRGVFSHSNVVIEMLHGVQPALLRRLKDRGIPTSICLAYGKEWYLHLLHRCAEFPQNIYQAIVDFANVGEIHNEYYHKELMK